MTIKHWIFLVLIIAEALVYVGRTGKEREPVTPMNAVCALIEWGLIGWLALS